jgi:hypothetical protein
MRREFQNQERWIPSRMEGPVPRRRDAPSSAGAVEDLPEESAGADRSRRRHARVHGPFDGSRIGRLETPVRIYDLSQGGCFVNAMHQQRSETRMVLKIDLPAEGTISVKAEMVYVRPEFGFAVRFIEVDAETDARLRRAVEALSLEQGGNP